MALMVYGRYGRTAIYQMQDALRSITASASDPGQALDLAKRVLGGLPHTNWFARSQDLVDDHIALGDTGLVDLLLHPCDRAFTVGELNQWIEDAGMTFVDFSYNRRMYDPSRWITDDALLAVIQRRSDVDRAAIAELLVGCLYCHFVYCAPTGDRHAAITDPDMIPSLWMDHSHLDLAGKLEDGQVDSEVAVTAATGAVGTLAPGPQWLCGSPSSGKA